MSALAEHDNTQVHSRFSGLLSKCRAIAVQHLNALYASSFDSVESTLLGFAEKAESNAIQMHFFEAIQEINRGRENIKRAFEGEIKVGFAQFAKGRPLAVAGGVKRTSETNRPSSTTGFDTGDLQLLNKLAHEEFAVIQTLSAKATHRYREALYALNLRLAIVNEGRIMEEIAVPAGPSHILYAFGESIRALRIEPNVRLVLFALFDRVVMSQLETLYEDINRCLMNAGVLPNLRPAVNKRADSGAGSSSSRHKIPPAVAHNTATSAPAGGERCADTSMGDQLLDAICDLLATHRRATQAFTAAKQTGTEGEIVEPYPDSTVLISAITQMQVAKIEAIPTSYSDFDSDEKVEKDTLETIRLNLRAERNRIYDGLDRRRIPQVDIDVIDVVGLLFDCILSDEILPNVVKAWLCRLHTPYLKMAVLDKKIFKLENHPARRLLNIMVDAGEQWVSEDNPRAGILPQMKYVVNRVLRGFRDEPVLFEELLVEFTDAVEALKQKSGQIEQRAREAADGHEKLQNARERAQLELGARTDVKIIPLVAQKFLAEIWADNLMLILLRSRDGEHSQEWAEALRIGDEIVWSVTPKHTEEERKQLAARLPELQRNIKEQIGSLGGYGRHEQEDLFSLLKELQQNSLQASVESVDDTDAATTLHTLSDSARTMESALTSESATVKAEVISNDEQNVIDELRTLKVGTLFDFRCSEVGNIRRLKLSWQSEATSTYMFVDQAGVKAAVYSILDLARAVLTGDAHRVNERRKPFFEGAMEAIHRLLSGISGAQ